MVQMKLLLVSPLFLLLACDSNPEPTQLSGRAAVLGVSKVVAPIDSATSLVEDCAFEASPTEFTSSVLLDTAVALELTLPFTVVNQSESEIDGLTPLRMDIVWECETSGFSGEVGPLVLPTFDSQLPFCLSSQSPSGSFVGFDVVSASGGRIPGAGGLGIAHAQVVPFHLGRAIDETIRIGSLAEQCCFETRATNCDGQSTAVSCTRLTQMFQSLNPTGSELSVAALTGPSEDLIRFKPFGLFNGSLQCGLDQSACDANPEQGPAYTMHLRGALELLDADGNLTTSDEFNTRVDFCRNCGYWNGLERFPAFGAESQCFAM
jgi:hypothetical protein